MKGTPVEKLVYEHMFPKARASDPDNFQAFLTRYLVGEVRSETQAFYGHLETQEAKYPGLDYANRTHRIRLSRYPWHRRLFRAFDALGLTPAEIANLTRWEGTKWAKEKYELEHGVKIRDTTADGIPTWDDELGRAVGEVKDVTNNDDEAINNEDEQEEEEDNDNDNDAGDDREAAGDDQGDEEASESELLSVGIELNARLRAGAARREAGDTNAVLDEEWEQWLKHIIDSGLLHDNMSQQAFRQFFESTVVPAGLVPAEVMSAARAGRWSDVPEYLHSLLRRTLEPEQRAQWDSAAGGTSPGGSGSRNTYSDLRLPVGESGTSQMTADAPGA